MDSRSRWITIAFLAFVFLVGPFRILAFLHDLGLYPKTTEDQVVAELKRRTDVQSVKCQTGGEHWDFVCDVEVQPRGRPPVRHRNGIKTSWNTAIARAIPLPIDGPVLPADEAIQWFKEEQKRLAAPINVRTATIADLLRIPRVDQYRAQEIHAAVRAGLVRKFDDLLKIQGIDQATLKVMRTRAYWE